MSEDLRDVVQDGHEAMEWIVRRIMDGSGTECMGRPTYTVELDREVTRRKILAITRMFERLDAALPKNQSEEPQEPEEPEEPEEEAAPNPFGDGDAQAKRMEIESDILENLLAHMEHLEWSHFGLFHTAWAACERAESQGFFEDATGAAARDLKSLYEDSLAAHSRVCAHLISARDQALALAQGLHADTD